MLRLILAILVLLAAPAHVHACGSAAVHAPGDVILAEEPVVPVRTALDHALPPLTVAERATGTDGFHGRDVTRRRTQRSHLM